MLFTTTLTRCRLLIQNCSGRTTIAICSQFCGFAEQEYCGRARCRGEDLGFIRKRRSRGIPLGELWDWKGTLEFASGLPIVYGRPAVASVCGTLWNMRANRNPPC